MFVQVIKNTVIGATRDLAVASYFPQPASPVEAGRAFPQSASPVEAGRAEARKGYAGTVRTAFRSAVVQYLRVGTAPLLTFLLPPHLDRLMSQLWLCGVVQETASRMNFPDSPYDAPPPDPTEGPGSDGPQPHTGSTGADVAGDNGWQRFSFHRCTSGTSTATGSSTTTEVRVALQTTALTSTCSVVRDRLEQADG